MDYIHFFLIDMKVTAKIPWPQLYNMMIGYDIYDRFTMEHFLLCQSMILT
jgi:hypothetical protein